MRAHIKKIAFLALLCAAILLVTYTRAQVLDGDEQFQAYHQDISRISGSNGAQVAPQSTIVNRVQTAGNGPQQESTPVNSEATSPLANTAAPQHSPSPRGSRKPNRITLVARRDPLPSASASLAPLVGAQQAPVALQSQSQLFVQPQAQSQLPAPVHQQQQPASNDLVLGPALASFQGGHNPSLSTSVLARHTALMAEVAAERAAASSQQPSLGSPLEALSSPSVAQAAAPVRHQAQAAIENPTIIASPQAEEPVVAPSFEQVLSRGCPHKGVFSWENKDHCDRYYMCTNGTFTEEACPNGLAYSQMGAVYQHCAYNWNVDCGRKKGPEPIASPGCPWQFGIFPILQNGRCSIDYYACEWGVPETKRCSPEGLFYDDRIKGCQWADQLGCKSEALLNFKCPSEDEDNPYWPYPRYYHNTQDVIVCVNEQPRLVHCNEDQLVDPSSLACIDVKKKKKFQA